MTSLRIACRIARSNIGEIQTGQVVEQKVGGTCFEIRRGRYAGSHRDGANAIFTRGEDLLGRVADQRNFGFWSYTSFPSCPFDREARQAAARGRHLAESTELEVVVKPGALQL